MAAFVAFSLITLQAANAAVIKPDTAVASSVFSGGYVADNTINGTGLTGTGINPAEAHADYAFGNHWTTANGTDPVDAFITWGFNVGQTLGGIYIWNHRSNDPGHASNPGYEPTLFDLTVTHFGGSLVLNDVSIAPDTATAQGFGFGSVLTGVTSVRFDVEAVQSSPTFTGLAEVAFETTGILNTPVPLPAGLPLFGTGLALLGFVGWRRKHAAAA